MPLINLRDHGRRLFREWQERLPADQRMSLDARAEDVDSVGKRLLAEEIEKRRNVDSTSAMDGSAPVTIAPTPDREVLEMELEWLDLELIDLHKMTDNFRYHTQYGVIPDWLETRVRDAWRDRGARLAALGVDPMAAGVVTWGPGEFPVLGMDDVANFSTLHVLDLDPPSGPLDIDHVADFDAARPGIDPAIPLERDTSPARLTFTGPIKINWWGDGKVLTAGIAAATAVLVLVGVQMLSGDDEVSIDRPSDTVTAAGGTSGGTRPALPSASPASSAASHELRLSIAGSLGFTLESQTRPGGSPNVRVETRISYGVKFHDFAAPTQPFATPLVVQGDIRTMSGTKTFELKTGEFIDLTTGARGPITPDLLALAETGAVAWDRIIVKATEPNDASPVTITIRAVTAPTGYRLDAASPLPNTKTLAP